MTGRIAYNQVAPDRLKALAATRPYISSSNIEPRLRALVELRVSQINGCAYCVDMHSHEARQAGEGQQRLDCVPVWRETPLELFLAGIRDMVAKVAVVDLLKLDRT